MKVYDTIGSEYRQWRSSDIGVDDIQNLQRTYQANTVLELGCGNGYPIAEAVMPLVDTYVGVDSSDVLLSEFRSNLPTAEAIHCPIEQLNLDGRQFDLVFSFGCLFHLKPDAQRTALVIAANAVKQGGVLSFNSGAEEGYTTGHVANHQLDHWSLGELAYIKLLQSEGLQYVGSHLGRGQNLFFTFSKS